MLRFFRVLAVAIGVLATAIVPLIAAAPAEARAACGPRGCAAAGCGPRGCAAGAVGRPAYRPAPVYRHPVYRPPGVVVVNPGRYYWPPGGAVAAGVAIGFIAGAAAVSVAGQPPKPGYCWYYTNPQKTAGFWDVCP